MKDRRPDVVVEMLADVNLDTDMNIVNKNGIIVVSITCTLFLLLFLVYLYQDM